MTPRHLALLFVVSLLTFVVHEFAHGVAGSLLGFEMTVSSNHSGAARGAAFGDRQQILVSLAGPAITLLQGALGVWLALARNWMAGFSLVFSALLMRLAAAGVSFGHLNDEALASVLLGLPAWLLPLVAVAILGGGAVAASRGLGLGWKSWVGAWVVTSIGITLMVMGEAFLPTYTLPAMG